ncbi:TonB-linked SusC/RagA family outer membrane protein [Chitinophaga skermanii]|uniref:TonB-linked SusC/RagA family outer membrane protein n=1 Tax=Chitinophaga skermanii TaxID=331697 RepID=A0A327RAQ4_9BACT|nr:SusC/RagA family TonB-linked outer membrane protein [Chitinophaga skermanii]RAJ11007.1 TonB-linked SusC/RagA family outer membrane protein [Chitinophaga skermanii]
MKKALLFFTMLMVSISLAYAQERQVTGKIVDSDGTAVPFATLQIKGTTRGTTADQNGVFKLTAHVGNTLVVRSVGFLQKEIAVSGSGELSITLESSNRTLDEVVIGAGGVAARKREIGYNATIVNSQQLVQARPVNVASGLSGKVAGLQVNAISGGVNPTVRLVLRGQRSLLGNNTALVVLDNVIVPSNILSNLNPDDIEDINVLNGASAAAIYGSDASNGALIVTTKKGKNGSASIKFSQTLTAEQVSYYPKLQTEFGSGATGNGQVYTPYENQQYGPRFDGSMVQIGRPLRDGTTQKVAYSNTNDKKHFWETGLTSQSDLALSSGDDKGTSYLAVQYAKVNGTTPKDEYNRFGLRANGTRNVGDKVKIGYNTYYTQNRYDITSATSGMYDQLLNTPAHIPLTKYKDWQNDMFANPQGYYNDYYANPYFTIDNNRSATRNDYLVGSAEIRYSPFKWGSAVYRVGLSTQNSSFKNTTGRFIYEDSYYVTGSKANIPGSVSDGSSYETQITSDLQLQFEKRVNDFTFNLILGQFIRNNTAKSVGVSSNGNIIKDLYNVSVRLGELGGGESNSTARQVAVWGNFKVGYKNFAFLELTGRNDWRSVLPQNNWSFFYPSVNASFIATEAIDALKDNSFLNLLKLRGGWSKIGQASIGAYALESTFSPARGFPYPSGPGFTANNLIVDRNLKPEMTTAWEAGFDAELWNNRINLSATYFSSSTVNQTVTTGVSTASGYSQYLRNTGEVTNKGLELTYSVVAYKTKDLQITVGGNYTHNDNKVVSISSDVPRLQMTTGGTAQVYAVPGMAFPVIYGVDYLRDDKGRIIVDKNTGYPSADPEIKYLGNTNPKDIMGLNLEVKYKNWRLFTLFEHRSGYVIYNNGASTYDFSGSSIRTTQFGRERFVIPNSSYWDDKSNSYVANTSVMVRDGGTGYWADGDGGYNMAIASNYVYSGAFWKLREMALTYNLPASFLGKTKVIKNASVSLQGRNLFLWVPKSNLYTDPEYSFTDGNAVGITTLGQTPPSRYFGGNISITF